MVTTTFFGNRARVSVLEGPVAISVTLTNGSTAYSAPGASTGDYVWLTADGQQYACRVGTGTLSYTYKGTGGTGAGFRCTPTQLQVLRGLTVEFNWDVQELYGTDSIFRVDEAKHNLKITHNAKYCKWNPDVTVDWVNKVLAPSGATGAVEDTNVAYVNGAVYYVTGSASGTMEIVLADSYYEGVPYPMPENDFIIRDLKGYARKGVVNYY